MSKRSAMSDINNINSNTENFNIIRKKIKTEHDFIISKSKAINRNIDLTEHEVNKFLIIFHTLLETVD